ncbi:BCCT family transporter [Aeoliella sp. ICT_H6.2]|uniref:BCCT family transporter n=1 Tax=Aeoliella straminimaris TaxID=2954799 RepID=A0A9X2F892_9BACT|nr:BCCT family transporter [Aeoliella straminimaris]MCO6043659.1 BCCT family transporter [Aeoliella straminimaris]
MKRPRVVERFTKLLQLKTDPGVFFTSALLIAGFVLFGIVFTKTAVRIFGTAQSLISSSMGWFYHTTVTLCLIFCLVLCCTKYGKVKLGKPEDHPEFGYLTWFSMLFSAGMGIGILFWSVAEPITHLETPPVQTASAEQTALLAMDITLLHWGLHGWCIFAVAGLGMAHAAYRRGQLLTFRAVLFPVLGKKTHGLIGGIVDIFAILGTMFGVATSLGFGAQQLNAGLSHLTGIEHSVRVQILLIVFITALATASVVSGLDRGIKLLSKLAILMAIPLWLYVIIAGPTSVGLESIFVYGGNYLRTVFEHALVSSFGGSVEWQSDWTLFYWGWWIAWSPFVGLFLARISKGRTIREFMLGVLLLPTLVTCVWFCVFGGMGIDRVENGDTELVTAVTDNFSIAIFVFFNDFPASTALSAVSLVVIIVFFVTSSDSASLVIDYIASGGDRNPPKRQRVFWATLEGVVAAVLLLGGGIAPMRAFQIMTGLPLAVILLLICFSVARSLIREEPIVASCPSPLK